MILTNLTTPLIPGNGAAGVAAEVGEARDDCGPAVRRIDPANQATGRPGGGPGGATHPPGQPDRQSSRFPLFRKLDAAAGRSREPVVKGNRQDHRPYEPRWE